MKSFVLVALVALIALSACVEARKHALKASSKTIVTVEPELHRFCIPVGKTVVGNARSVSLHVPRRANGLSVKLDSQPLTTFSSVADDKFCKRLSSTFLVNEYRTMSSFNFASSEVQKSGTVSGWIVGPKPAWISVRVDAVSFRDVSGSADICESVLGEKSESAFENKEDDDDDRRVSRPSRALNILVAIRRGLFWGAISGAVALIIISILRCIAKRCAKKEEQALQNEIEMGSNSADAHASEEADIALAIERSLADEKKVVEVPQAAAPQFVFVPPQVMPHGFHPGATPYVPMFAPQFMNYSLEERK